MAYSYIIKREKGSVKLFCKGTEDNFKNFIEEIPIEKSLKLQSHSPTGFEYGYNGSGPAQLALAILLDYTERENFSLKHYQEFKRKVISKLDRNKNYHVLTPYNFLLKDLK